MEPETGKNLVVRLHAGDPDAFDEIYCLYNARLLRFLTRMARNRAVAEDLLEETWLRLVASGAALEEDSRLGPWLFTVARNLYVSYCRSRAREEAYTAELVLLWPGEMPESPQRKAIAAEFEEHLEEALAGLPAKYREVLLLCGVEGLSAAEVGAICGATAEAVRQRLSRARAQLAKRLKEQGVWREEISGERRR